jgi:hypothetical protein
MQTIHSEQVRVVTKLAYSIVVRASARIRELDESCFNDTVRRLEALKKLKPQDGSQLVYVETTHMYEWRKAEVVVVPEQENVAADFTISSALINTFVVTNVIWIGLLSTFESYSGGAVVRDQVQRLVAVSNVGTPTYQESDYRFEREYQDTLKQRELERAVQKEEEEEEERIEDQERSFAICLNPYFNNTYSSILTPVPEFDPLLSSIETAFQNRVWRPVHNPHALLPYVSSPTDLRKLVAQYIKECKRDIDDIWYQTVRTTMKFIETNQTVQGVKEYVGTFDNLKSLVSNPIALAILLSSLTAFFLSSFTHRTTDARLFRMIANTSVDLLMLTCFAETFVKWQKFSAEESAGMMGAYLLFVALKYAGLRSFRFLDCIPLLGTLVSEKGKTWTNPRIRNSQQLQMFLQLSVISFQVFVTVNKAIATQNLNLAIIDTASAIIQPVSLLVGFMFRPASSSHWSSKFSIVREAAAIAGTYAAVPEIVKIIPLMIQYLFDVANMTELKKSENDMKRIMQEVSEEARKSNVAANSFKSIMSSSDAAVIQLQKEMQELRLNQASFTTFMAQTQRAFKSMQSFLYTTINMTTLLSLRPGRIQEMKRLNIDIEKSAQLVINDLFTVPLPAELNKTLQFNDQQLEERKEGEEEYDDDEEEEEGEDEEGEEEEEVENKQEGEKEAKAEIEQKKEDEKPKVEETDRQRRIRQSEEWRKRIAYETIERDRVHNEMMDRHQRVMEAARLTLKK